MIAPPTPTSTRFVLVQPSHAGNVGAVARAMKVMGFSDLVLVEPRYADVLAQAEAVAFASGAEDVLRSAQVVDSLTLALEGITFACATAMTPRDFGPPTHSPRQALPPLADQGHHVAFVFGSERFGLANEDVWRCHQVLTIPTSPAYGSLNLAQAVQVIAWEWRQALGGFAVVPSVAPSPMADARAVQGVLAHWERALVSVGFLNPRAPKKLIPRLNQLANRLRLTHEEVHILRGIARAMEQAAGPRPPSPTTRATPTLPAACEPPIPTDPQLTGSRSLGEGAAGYPDSVRYAASPCSTDYEKTSPA